MDNKYFESDEFVRFFYENKLDEDFPLIKSALESEAYEALLAEMGVDLQAVIYYSFGEPCSIVLFYEMQKEIATQRLKVGFDTLHISEFEVHKNKKRHGLGGSTLRHFLDENNSMVYSLVCRDGLVRFYQTAGFQTIKKGPDTNIMVLFQKDRFSRFPLNY